MELGKDIRIFLTRDDASWPTSMTDMYTGDGAAGERIRQLRSELSEQWMVSFFETPADLAGLVAAALNQAVLASREQRALEVKVAAETPEPGTTLERIVAPQPIGTALWWWKTAIERAAAVALVRTSAGEPRGTAFLVRGGDLHPAFGDEVLGVTASYIVSAQPAPLLGTYRPLLPDEALIEFELADIGEQGIYEVIWESPQDHLSTTVFRIENPPAHLVTPPISPAAPGGRSHHDSGWSVNGVHTARQELFRREPKFPGHDRDPGVLEG